jgi:hypothetical protein
VIFPDREIRKVNTTGGRRKRRKRKRKRYFTRHPITRLNFNKTISKPCYSQAIL